MPNWKLRGIDHIHNYWYQYAINSKIQTINIKHKKDYTNKRQTNYNTSLHKTMMLLLSQNIYTHPETKQ